MYDIKGLTKEEVLNNRKLYGSNKITEKKKTTILSLIIESLNDPIIKILLIALGIKILFFINDSDIYETIGIIIAIILATVISSLSEYGSEKAFQKLSNTTNNILVKAYRNNLITNIKIEEIVVNDYIYLESGDKIPADGILYTGNISVDESMLSGETKEQNKTSMSPLYRGSVITNGSGVLLVKKVGNNTYYGKIAKDIQEKTPTSPLKNRLRVLASFISKIGYICAFLVILSYLFNVIVVKNNFDINRIKTMLTSFNTLVPHLLYSLTLGITIIVVAVPEGLPMMITLVLSSNMKRLLKENVLVRKLVGIESSGSLNILFTDKTGTLTKGELEMVGFVTFDNTIYKTIEEIKKTKLKEITLLNLQYNTNSTYINNEIIGGNITDRAIIKFTGPIKENKYKILNKEEFNSKKKYSKVTLNYETKTEFYKGAYELIIDKCSYFYKSDGTKSIIKNKQELINLGNSYTEKGYRVLACSTSNNLTNGVFLGFILIKDEIRPTTIEGIKKVTESGIQMNKSIKSGH